MGQNEIKIRSFPLVYGGWSEKDLDEINEKAYVIILNKSFGGRVEFHCNMGGIAEVVATKITRFKTEKG